MKRFILSLFVLVTSAYILLHKDVEKVIPKISFDAPCLSMKYDNELYKTCLLVEELEDTHANVQIDID
tara:strand:- start:552 stop:755 length:204 start_codon:yes stop_codon:yes gene_type:complete